MKRFSNFCITFFRGTFAGSSVVILFILFYSLGLAQAQGPLMIGLGDSIGEGVQSADANFATQPYCYLNLLAGRIGFGINLPLIETSLTGMVGDTSNRSRLSPFEAATNLSVSGADVESLINDRADAVSVQEINSETDLVLFPNLGSQIEIAESMDAFLTICWIGNNDVLSAATSFDQLNATQMTPIDEFESNFEHIAQRLIKPGKIVVFANIPDVTSIAFLMDRQDLVAFLGSDFGLEEGEYTSMVAMLIIKLGFDDGSILNNPDFILDAGEIQVIQERIEAFNQIIEETAASYGMPVVDINAIFRDMVINPPSPFGIPLTTRFLGGIFSLDGVHPSNISHVIIANAFIGTLNNAFNANIPPIGPMEYLSILISDPFVDKDGDGRVMGRFGFGFLETMGPTLGISGDGNDWVPDSPQSLVQENSANEVMSSYLSLKGKEPKQTSKWRKKDILEAFRDILKTRGFDR